MPNPGDPQALNRYSYSANNPLRFSDPTGHAQQDMGGGVATGIAIAAGYALRSQATQALNVWVADAQLLYQQLVNNVLVYGIMSLVSGNADKIEGVKNADSGGNPADPGGQDPDKLNRIRAKIDEKTQRFQDKFGDLKSHLTQSDLEAAQQEAAGQPLQHWVERGGSPTGHLQEVMHSQDGLAQLIQRIQGQLTYVVDGVSPLSVEQRLALERLLGQASKLLDYSEGYVPQ